MEVGSVGSGVKAALGIYLMERSEYRLRRV